MKSIISALGICGVLMTAAAFAKTNKPTPSSQVPKGCALRLRQCVVFWKEEGKEYMGGGTLGCDEAEDYIARRNKEMGEGTNWFRPIYVNTDIDLQRDCASPEEIEKSKKGTPWKDVIPGTKKKQAPVKTGAGKD